MQESTSNVSPTPLREYKLRKRAWWGEALYYAVLVLFFLFFFMYVLRTIDPAVIYSNNGFNIPSYIRYLHEKERDATIVHVPDRYSGDGYILELTPRYFKELFSVPGGLTKLLVTLVIYSCNYPYTGALVVTGLAWLLFFLFPFSVRRQGSYVPFFVKLVPAIAVLFVVHFYELNALAHIVPIIGALASVMLYQRVCDHGFFRKMVAMIVIFWSGWYLFQWAALLFLALTIIDVLFTRPNRLRILIVAVLNASTLFLIEARIIAPENAIRFDSFLTWPLPSLLLNSWFLMLASLRYIRPGRLSRVLRRIPQSFVFRLSVDVILVVGMTFCVITWAHQDPLMRDIRSAARAVHYIQNRMWDKLLVADFSAQFSHFPEKFGPLQRYLVHARIRGLARSGRLGDDMFSYPQATFSPEPLLLRKSILEFGFPLWAAAADLFIELGLVNYAEKTIGELMECMGPYPFLMYRRALLHLAKNNSETASIYLEKLSAMPFYRREARALLDILGDSIVIAAHPRIAHLRSCMDTTDYFFLANDEEGLLLHLLERNPGNKLAYEYLMAAYLQTGRVEKLVERLDDARALGYPALPRHWEEAICVYMTREDRDTLNAADIGISMISPDTFLRFDQFMQMYFLLEGNPMAAKKLGPLFGSTYYYFYSFESSYGVKL